VVDESTRILVQLAADETAVWLPNRVWTGRRPGNVYTARRDFAAAGVPWATGGGDEALRKERQRVLEALARAGAVRVFRPRRVRTLTVKLSAAARAAARALAGQPGERAAFVSMQELARHSKRPARLLLDAWIPETRLIGEPPAGRTWGVEAALTEDLLGVALIRGWAVSNADGRGRVYYALTRAGWEWLAEPEPADDDGRPDPAAVEWFTERLEASMARLDSESRDPREIGLIPLPSSMGGQPMTATCGAD